MPINAPITVTTTSSGNVSIPLPAQSSGDSGKIPVADGSNGFNYVAPSSLPNITVNNLVVSGNAGDVITLPTTGNNSTYTATSVKALIIDDTTNSVNKTKSSTQIATDISTAVSAIRQVPDATSATVGQVLTKTGSGNTLGFSDIASGITVSAPTEGNVTNATFTGTTAPIFATGNFRFSWQRISNIVLLQIIGKATTAGVALTSFTIPLTALGIPLAKELPANLVNGDYVFPTQNVLLRSTTTTIAPTASACGLVKATGDQVLTINHASGSLTYIELAISYIVA